MARYENFNVNKLSIVHGQAQTPGTGNAVYYIVGPEKTVTADGVVTALTIPANTYVHSVVLEETTSAGEACTCSVGDSVSAAGYITGASLNVTNGTRYMTSTADTYWTGKKYTSDSNISATVELNGGTGSVKFKVHALVSKF